MGANAMMYGMLGASAVGTGLSSAQAYADAAAQQQAARVNAAQSQQNAQLARISADKTRQFGQTEAADVRREYKTLMGQQRAAYGASGVAVNAGSAAAVVSNTAAEGVFEAQKTEYARNLEAWQLEREAANYDFEAAKFNAASSGSTPWLNAAAAGIGGLTGIYSNYYNWKKK